MRVFQELALNRWIQAQVEESQDQEGGLAPALDLSSKQLVNLGRIKIKSGGKPAFLTLS
jgi:hypothetical protein